MKWKVLIIVVLIVGLTILNYFTVKGQHSLFYYDELEAPYESSVRLSSDGVIEVEKIVYDPVQNVTRIELKGIDEGRVTIYLKNGEDQEERAVDIVVNKIGFVYEEDFIGSLSNFRIVGYEILGFLLLSIAYTIYKILIEKKKTIYSYKLMFYVGVFFFLLVTLLAWTINVLKESINYNTLYGLYGDIVGIFNTFGLFVFPFMFILAIFLIISNIALIKHEGKSFVNTLGIIMGLLLIFVPIIGVFAIYFLMVELTQNYSNGMFHVSYFVQSSIFMILAYFECLMIGAYVCTRRAGKYVPKFNKDYVIILGCSIRKDGTVTPLLKGRVDRAIWFANKQKEAEDRDLKFVASGGQGCDEVVSEAEAIKRYLLDNGVSEDKIIVEDKSTTTYENMKFSYAKILEDAGLESEETNKKEIPAIAFSTTNYHVFRSGNIAESQGIRVIGMGGKTKWYFHVNALIREFVAILNLERKKHLFNILFVIFGLAIMTLLSYYFDIM